MRVDLRVRAYLVRGDQVWGYRGKDGVRLFGGRVKPKESLRDAVHREVAEEAGIAVEVGPLLWARELPRQRGRRVLELTYYCRADEGAEFAPDKKFRRLLVRLAPSEIEAAQRAASE